MEVMEVIQAIMMGECREHTRIRTTMIRHTIITTTCITMAVFTAMAIIDTGGIGIMAVDTIIEGIMVDIMVALEDIMGVDIDMEEDLQEAPIGAADTTVEVVGDTVDPVAGDMPEAEVIEVAATAEVVEATGAAVVEGAVEVTAVVAPAEAIDTLL